MIYKLLRCQSLVFKEAGEVFITISSNWWSSTTFFIIDLRTGIATLFPNCLYACPSETGILKSAGKP